jgi:hypothetical protein
VKPCDQNILRTIQLSQEMMLIADQGDAEREDTGCGILYGILRDAAYKILKLAEEERARHQAKGWWQDPDEDQINSEAARHKAQRNTSMKEEEE